jgi:hypothetical protein
MDYLNLPTTDKTQVFYGTNPVTGTVNEPSQIWTKPRGCKFVFIFGLGGGGGGGAGQGNVAGTLRAGGGGGGSGAQFSLILPSFMIPDCLYLRVGIGGVGGTIGNGTSGTRTIVSFTPFFSNAQYATTSLIIMAGAGVFGQVVTGGIPGQITLYWASDFRLSHQIPGQTGRAGGNGVAGTSVVLQYNGSSGAGGGGVSIGNVGFNGGSIVGNGFVPTRQGGTLANMNGESGLNLFNPSSLLTNKYPLFFIGGAGGFGNPNGIGGRGGDAIGYGTGGGGGGAGLTGGAGGNGGDGLVIITCW